MTSEKMDSSTIWGATCWVAKSSAEMFDRKYIQGVGDKFDTFCFHYISKLSQDIDKLMSIALLWKPTSQ